MKTKKKVGIAVIPTILIILFIFIFLFIGTTQAKYGTLIFWINSYDPPCEDFADNQTYAEICKSQAFKFSTLYVDNIDNKVADGTSITCGEYWSVELRLKEGDHKLIIDGYKGGTITVGPINVTHGETTYFEMPHAIHPEYWPDFDHTNNPPPNR